MAKRYGWLLLILLAAASLRLANLSTVPPGLTHDEADHGLDAWGVVNGNRPIYFTVGFGREPLFDYATAGLMSFLGPTYLAGRLTAVFFSLMLIASTYAWSRVAFDERTALLTAAGLAVSFWAVMTSRQALRSISLPALFALTSYCFWRALQLLKKREWTSAVDSWLADRGPGAPTLYFLAGGILLGITFYTYLPARILWPLFPALLLYLALFNRPLFHRAWKGTLLMLLVAAAIGLPLFAYLARNPAAEVRLEELSVPLTEAIAGEFGLLRENIVAGLGLLTIEGDGQWRYNISGRPLLSPLMSVLFLAGLAVALWWLAAGMRNRKQIDRSAAAFFALSWLLLGLSPALITGRELSTTRIIGLQPVLFVFPALALSILLNTRFIPKTVSRAVPALMALLFAALYVHTARSYFTIWANEPEVRVQYETSLVTAVDYLNEFGQGPAAISTTTPERFHSPAAALLTLRNPDVSLRWFNGQHSLVLPQTATSTLIFTGFAPLNPFLEPYFQATSEGELALRPTDLDRPLSIFSAKGPFLLAKWQELFSNRIEGPAGAVPPINFDDTAELLGYDVQTPAVRPGEQVRLATLWRVNQPLDDAILFTHVVGPDGQPVAQADRLDVPSHSWVHGDLMIQLHQFKLPEDLPAGDYPIVVGIYRRGDLQRLPIIVDSGIVADHLQLPTLNVRP